MASPRVRPKAEAAERRATLRLLVGTAGGIFVLDQATKWLIVQRLDLRTVGAIDVWPPFVNLRMAWNRGVNFGIGAGFDMRWALIALAVVISAFVVAWVRRDGAGRAAHFAAGLLVGGALGNVVDRVLYGAVADFLNMGWWGFDNPYSFNVADISVFAGAIGLVLAGGPRRQRAR